MFRSRALTGLLAGALLTSLVACGGTGAASTGDSGGKTVTVYSADGLADWYKTRFEAFTKQTGTKVQLVEAGSGEVVSRLQKEKSNPQADVVITLPPFIQKASADKLLQDYQVPGSDQVKGPKAADYVTVIDNYLAFIVNSARAGQTPKTFDDLLDPRFKGKLQYSTPGQAGDGTAVLLLLQHLLGKQGALDYLKKLEANNVGPSASTGKLQPKVSKGEIWVANGDVQMNLTSISAAKSAFTLLFPATADGKRSTVALPYVMGLGAGAPNKDGGEKLMTYLLSPEAQQTAASDAFGLPARSDVKPTDANFQAAQKATAGVEIWQPDWNAVLADLDADVAAYNKAVQG
ncbi:2-aminoethylphosphonate ABC transporter substrate-binding protein [Streptomyces sp. SID13031]|uniref:2-aminoethylphosphonate ABC transporter substrate-binding protein n=1 Tax=Streptomyces sp. SID13031 TaxID=2706046 RepID=UPI0013CC1303|nr:2-aminoethylphosphonate ABC transporter substrate-binding protein [Streptomyces sp. SID13031]NEA32155.1 2-aminoethylphosphonate ABC transporter substrate-binding protein [Streptomyces sp. SID13031]